MKMIEYEEVQREYLEELYIKCDVCGKKEEYIGSCMLQIRYTGEYNSKVIGDLNDIEIDICEVCFMSKLGKFVRFI